MSLRGPAWPRCVRRLFVGSPLRRPRRTVGNRFATVFFLAMTTSAPESALAKCHIFRVWHYPKPQRCFTALAPERHVSRETARREAGFVSRKAVDVLPERIEIPLPDVLFEPCPEADERFQAIAKLHALMDAPRL